MNKRTVTPINTGIVKIQDDDQTTLGILLSGKKKNYALTQFARLKQAQGYLVGEQTIKEWFVSGVIEQEGKTYFYGPYEEGEVLYEIIKKPTSEKLHYIQRLVNALQLLKSRGQPIPAITGNSVLFLKNGSVLFLPEEIMERATHQLEGEEARFSKELIRHPDSTGEEAISFTLGAICYRLLSGEFPFYDENEEMLHFKIRSQMILPPRLVNPEVREDVSQFIMNSLQKGDLKHIPTVDDWAVTIKVWLEEGVMESVSDEERALLQAEAERKKKKAEKAFKTKDFFLKHRTTIIIAAVVSVVVVWFGGSILKNILEPPVTVGLPPREVVGLFYNSMNDLDHIAMEDCLAPNTAKVKVNEITRLYVISKMRLANEGKAGIHDARTWEEEGRPPIGNDETIYGITDFTIERRHLSENEASYIVEYLKYAPITGNEELQSQALNEAPPKIAVLRFKEQVELENKGNYWEIYRITQLEAEELPPLTPEVR